MLSPKESRRRERSAHRETRPPRSPEDRQAEREQVRALKLKWRQAGRERSRTRRSGRAAPAPAPPAGEQSVGRPKVRQGVVVSDKADKTITVRIDIARRHRRYQKVVHSTRTLHAHDEGNEAHEGDTVRVVESRPTSRTKRWRLVDVLERAK
jgi:small subunit ribosomal protein S17